MRYSYVYGALSALALIITANPALAVSCGADTTINVEIYQADGTTSGLSSISCSVNGTTIQVIEDWNSTNAGILQITGHNIPLPAGQVQDPYTIEKIIRNNSGTSFTSISNELLDLDGVGSNDTDGLSFAQAGFQEVSLGVLGGTGFVVGFLPTSAAGTFNAPETYPSIPGAGEEPDMDPLLYLADGSGIFDSMLVDQFGNRDFLNFFGGDYLPTNDDDEDTNDHVTTLTFGLRDRLGTFEGGFLLAQTPNFDQVPEEMPEPGMLLIFGAGLIGMGALRRRKRFV